VVQESTFAPDMSDPFIAWSSTTFSNAGGRRNNKRLLHWVHDHSSILRPSVLVRVISCAV